MARDIRQGRWCSARSVPFPYSCVHNADRPHSTLTLAHELKTQRRLRLRRRHRHRRRHGQRAYPPATPAPLELTHRTQRSRTSKRSRNSSHGSHASSSTAVSSQTAVSSTSARSAHSCSACDACFPDASSLKRHGAAPATNEACRAAVEYGFEGAGAAEA